MKKSRKPCKQGEKPTPEQVLKTAMWKIRLHMPKGRSCYQQEVLLHLSYAHPRCIPMIGVLADAIFKYEHACRFATADGVWLREKAAFQRIARHMEGKSWNGSTVKNAFLVFAAERRGNEFAHSYYGRIEKLPRQLELPLTGS